MTVRIPGTKYGYAVGLSNFCIDVPFPHQEELFALVEAAEARGGHVDVVVSLPGQRRSRASENLLYPTARQWWLGMGYDNVTGWRLAKLKFGVSTAYTPGWKPDRPGQFIEYDGAIHFVVSESDYTQQEASDMIDRLRQDCAERGIGLEDVR